MTETQVLDDHTRELLFGIKHKYFKFEPTLDEIIDDFIEKPITNLDEINARLDTIQELVDNEDLRQKLETALQIFSIQPNDLCEQIYQAKNVLNYPPFREEAATKLKNIIGYWADLYEKLPDVNESDFKSKRLKNLASEYSALKNNTSRISVTGYLKYISNINKKINKLEVKSETKDYNGNPIIDLSELLSLLNVKYIEQFSEIIPESLEQKFASMQVYLFLSNEAIEKGYSKPLVVPKENNCLIIKNGKYDIAPDKTIIPNNTYLSDNKPIEVLEGVNDGGKTFDMKKALYIAVRALAGCYVPAKYAKVSVRDKIILKQKGVGDAISAFQQDCQSVIETTPKRNEYWLIGMDEAFTSTERKGGEALVYGYITNISNQKTSLLILSSHYANLSNAFKDIPRVEFNHFPFETKNNEIHFPHKKEQGPMHNYSYAIAVAKSRKFDGKIVKYAQERLQQRGF